MLHERTLVKKLVKALADTAEHLLNRGGIGDHGHLAVLSGKLSSINVAWGVLIDANFEACRAPVNKIDSLTMLDGFDGSVSLESADITPVDETACHVLVTAGLLAVCEQIGGVKGLLSHAIHKCCLVFLIVCHDWCKRSQHEMSTLERY